MRDSIQHVADEADPADPDVASGEVGSNNPVAVYQELGTPTIPPRSFLLEAALHKLPEIQEMVGENVAVVLRRSP
jgi:hypothetical protein